MVDFENALKSALDGVNDSFRRADADLHEVVTAAALALQRVTGGIAELALHRLSDTPEGTSYALKVSAPGSADVKAVQVGSFFVDKDGYPILSGPEMQLAATLGRDTRLKLGGVQISNRAGLEQHLSQALSEKDSPVVTYVAYLKRKSTMRP